MVCNGPAASTAAAVIQMQVVWGIFWDFSPGSISVRCRFIPVYHSPSVQASSNTTGHARFRAVRHREPCAQNLTPPSASGPGRLETRSRSAMERHSLALARHLRLSGTVINGAAWLDRLTAKHATRNYHSSKAAKIFKDRAAEKRRCVEMMGKTSLSLRIPFPGFSRRACGTFLPYQGAGPCPWDH